MNFSKDLINQFDQISKKFFHGANSAIFLFILSFSQHNDKDSTKFDDNFEKFKLKNEQTQKSQIVFNGFVCAFHPAARDSNPKHIIYAFINLNLNCGMLKI